MREALSRFQNEIWERHSSWALISTANSLALTQVCLTTDRRDFPSHRPQTPAWTKVLSVRKHAMCSLSYDQLPTHLFHAVIFFKLNLSSCFPFLSLINTYFHRPKCRSAAEKFGP